MTALTLGIRSSTRKVDERRLAIHPRHFERIDPQLRERIILERGYGERFGVSDATLGELVGRICDTDELTAAADVVMLPKPQPADLEELHDGQTLWGWPHCVQDQAITQLGIDKRLTLIAYEAMNQWTRAGGFGLHVFHRNNELAGYCSVLHALELIGSTGDFGRRLTACVIGSGATARGAVTALNGHGILDVNVLTGRSVAAVGSAVRSVQVLHIDHDDSAPNESNVITDHGRRLLAPFLAESDIVVNCTLQDPNAPLTYVHTEELDAFAPGSLIIDVSCDEGMGFDWAKPTSFADPMFTVGNNVRYYAVDHTPSYLWDSATWEISEAVLPFLPVVMAGPQAWEADETISRAIEIRDGVVRNPDILAFQHRESDYPYAAL